MSALSELLADHTDLPGSAVDQLQRLVGDWQLLADLSFADLLLWVRSGSADHDGGVVCVAQCRPTTSPTVLMSDLVGKVACAKEHPQVIRALTTGEIVRHIPTAPASDAGEAPVARQTMPESVLVSPDANQALREAIPVRCGDDVIAVLSRDTDYERSRVRSTLESAYTECADELCQMASEGTYPTQEDRAATHSSPRAGDGFIRLNTEGIVLYASPNAQSAYHRMGLTTDLQGQDLGTVTRSLITDPFDAQEVVSDIRAALAGLTGRRMEVEAHGATVLLRTLVLRPHGRLAGAAVLVRDVTEVKRRDRALLSKDATIREIHHRVKNNLQTVAALLRLQARRTENEEALVALNESVRRVTSIAAVHEMLSMSVDEEVDLDEVVDRLVPMMADVAAVMSPVKIKREGKLGVISAERATPLVMVLTELVQNAIEHAFDAGSVGTVLMKAERSARWLDVIVHDNGRGLPEGFSLERSDRLGLQIVRTLVTAELSGSIALQPGADGGTDAVLRVPLGRRGGRA